MQSLFLTIQLIAVAVLIAGVVGLTGAWAASTAEQSGRLGRLVACVFFVCLIASLALPMILHAAAWEATAGKFGWMGLTQTGARLTGKYGSGVAYSGLGGFFRGLIACGWIHGIYSSALVALATWYGVGRVPANVIAQSRLDMSPFATWWRVRLPIAFPWLATSLLATAALATTEMTVVDLYGFRTIADRFYLEFVADPTLMAIATTCLLPLLFAGGILFVIGTLIGPRLNVQSSMQSSVESSTGAATQQSTTSEHGESGWVGWGASMAASALAGLMVVVPFAGLIVKAGWVVQVSGSERTASWSLETFSKNLISAPGTFTAEYQWTLMIAIIVGVSSMVIAWFLAAIGRNHVRLQRWMDWGSILFVLIPGPIVGLTVVRLFQLELPGFRTLYHESLIPTMMALSVRAVPVAYWIVRAGYHSLGPAVMNAAELDVAWWRRIWSIDRPLIKHSLFAAALASGVVASGDVPALLPVIPPGVTTAGTRLFEQLHSGARYQEASLALWYVGAVTIVALVWSHWGARSKALSRGRM